MPHPGVLPPLAEEYVHAVLLKINMMFKRVISAWSRVYVSFALQV